MYEITRKISIDAAHRIVDHTSSCRDLHGHRYEIHATCQSEALQESGPERGMVIDFAVLKEELEKQIVAKCDHGLIIDANDQLVTNMLGIGEVDIQWVNDHRHAKIVPNAASFKVYLVPFPPTCEHLAQHWYEIMSEALNARSNGQVTAKTIRVYETPNCYADFPSVTTVVD